MYFYICKNLNNMQESFEPAETDFFNRKWKLKKNYYALFEYN